MAELERGRSLATRERRAQFLAGRVLARGVLARRLGGAADSIPLSAGPGRPRVVGDGRRVSVSIAHSRHLVAVAVGDGPVGVDIETRLVPGSVADRFFVADERRWLASLDVSERGRAAVALWTIKEAIGKARATGLVLPLPAVEVPVEGAGRTADYGWQCFSVEGGVVSVASPSAMELRVKVS